MAYQTKRRNPVKQVSVLAFVVALSLLAIFANVFTLAENVEAQELSDSSFSLWFNEVGSEGEGVVAGEQSNAAVFALDAMSAKGNSVEDADGVSRYTVQGSNNPRTAGSGSKGTVPDEGAAMAVKAPADGALTVYGINGAGKTFYIVNETSGEVLLEDSMLTDVSYELAVEADNTYWFYSNGSKFQFAGFVFEDGGEVSDDPLPTPTPVPIIGDDTNGEWVFTRFGASTNDAVNTIEEGADINGIVVLNSATYHEDGAIDRKGGKYVADSPADGISLYYRSYRPAEENFVLQADVTVDYMNPTPDGQEGFALMTRDSLSGSGSYFSNLFSVTATKLPIDGSEIRDVIGVRNYTGITSNENASLNNVVATRYGFDIDESFITQGNTYRVRIEKTSYGYISTQIDMATGEIIGEHIHYIPAVDPSATSVTSYEELLDPMRVQEADLAYVGLSVARGVNATFSNIIFETSPWQASEWKVQEIEQVDVNVEILGPSESATSAYDFVYRANADGVASILLGDEVLAENLTVLAGQMQTERIELPLGESTISLQFTPDASYSPGNFQELSSLETVTMTHNVMVRSIPGDVIYVRQDGQASNSGSSYEDALDMQTALSYAAPGQRILVYPGEYDMSGQSLFMARGTGGTEEAPIIVEADPAIGGHAHFHFGYTGRGFTTWASHIHYKNLAFSHSAQGSKGMQVSGHHNILENLIFFNNGSTGLQISGSSMDDPSLWPSYNEVINNTSMNNADRQLEDADGFAPKLTTGEGNIFRGSIAAYNADDGWDLFAKAGTGSIGTVEIHNSLTYRNGYILVDPSATVPEGLLETQWDVENPEAINFGELNLVFPEFIITEDGDLRLAGTLGKDVRVIRAGNGNGFKMGGTNMPGAHEIHDSIAYENRSKGFDSNSGIDIKVYDSTAFNNMRYNVAFYTNNRSATTGYEADGFLSYRKVSDLYPTYAEQLAIQGQDENAVYGESNYYWNRDAEESSNSLGETVSDSWFISLNTSITPIRMADGRINMQGLLMLTDEALAKGVGARSDFWVNAFVIEDQEDIFIPGETTEPTTEPVTEPTTESTTEEVSEPSTELTTAPTEETTEPSDSDVSEEETEVTNPSEELTEATSEETEEESEEPTTTSAESAETSISKEDEEVPATGENTMSFLLGISCVALAAIVTVATRIVKLKDEE